MLNYIIRRLLLLPLTLFCIIIINFVIINLAPGDPVSLTELSNEGEASRQEDRSTAFGSDERYLHFREHYGLTLPILFNRWPSTTLENVRDGLWSLVNRRWSVGDTEEMDVKAYDDFRRVFGDRSKYVMPHLLAVLEDATVDSETKQMASRFFVRGGTRQAILGSGLSTSDRAYNRKVAKDNSLLRTWQIGPSESDATVAEKINAMSEWYHANQAVYRFVPSWWQSAGIFFFETRFCRYVSRVVLLDFGTLRNDSNRKVIHEVAKRFKYSLTLAILPMLMTFVLCQVFGFLMALKQNGWQDLALNVIFLVLYAVPVFVVAPFLIEKIALHHHFPFTDAPIPISGFSSSESVYAALTSSERLRDILQHLALPLVAVMYGSLASQSRLSRTAVLEVLRQDYVRTAKAKGVPPLMILYKHVGRNAAITIVTSLAGSLGIVLGGSLIVETLFDINGFGKFFYDAVLNRDYNVIMFSAIAGSVLTLFGYLAADIAYTLLDPRVTLD